MSDLKIKDIKIIALVLAGIIVGMSLNAVFGDYGRYRINLLELKINKSKLSVLERERDSLGSRLAAFNADKEKLEGMLFNENGIADFLQRMPQEASLSGVRVLKMSAERNFKEIKQNGGEQRIGKQDKAQPTLMALPIRMVVKGPLSSVEDFLIDLEQYKQLLSVKDVKIMVKNYPLIEGDFTMTAYVIQEGPQS